MACQTQPLAPSEECRGCVSADAVPRRLARIVGDSSTMPFDASVRLISRDRIRGIRYSLSKQPKQTAAIKLKRNGAAALAIAN